MISYDEEGYQPIEWELETPVSGGKVVGNIILGLVAILMLAWIIYARQVSAWLNPPLPEIHAQVVQVGAFGRVEKLLPGLGQCFVVHPEGTTQFPARQLAPGQAQCFLKDDPLPPIAWYR